MKKTEKKILEEENKNYMEECIKNYKTESVRLFGLNINKDILNKMVDENIDLTNLVDDMEKTLDKDNYKTLLKISDYLINFGLKKANIWLRHKIASVIYKKDEFVDINERCYYTYIKPYYDISIEDYMVEPNIINYPISMNNFMKTINTTYFLRLKPENNKNMMENMEILNIIENKIENIPTTNENVFTKIEKMINKHNDVVYLNQKLVKENLELEKKIEERRQVLRSMSTKSI